MISFLKKSTNRFRLGRHINGNAVNGAIFGAFSATNALIGVDTGQRVGNRNGTVFAHFYALAAANAANLTRRTRYGAFIVTGATHHTVHVTVIHRNEALRTSRHTLRTTAANGRIHTSQTILYRDSLVFTNSLTVAVT